MSFLDNIGAGRFWQKAKAYIDSKFQTASDNIRLVGEELALMPVVHVDGTSTALASDIWEITQNFGYCLVIVEGGGVAVTGIPSVPYFATSFFTLYRDEFGNFISAYDTGLGVAVAAPSSGALSFAFDTSSSLYTDAVCMVQPATDAVGGSIMLNPSESITLNTNGQLDVGGRLGQMSGTTGVYSPKTINPSVVNDGSFLLTEASGTNLGSKSLAVSTGIGLTCRSAAAGSTVYRVTNTYVNRLSCSVLLVADAVAALNENDAKAGNFARVMSVQRGGETYVPDSSPNSTAQVDDIVITLDKSINPNSATTSIRVYPAEKSFSNLYVGQAVGGNGGASVVVGQRVMNYSGNACAVVGADIYNAGHGNAIFGRQHISRKNRWFIAGTGHDTTNGRSEAGAAIGQWSNITADTLFAIGNGADHTNRSNAFEVTPDGIVLDAPNGSRWIVEVDNDGTLKTVAV